MGAFQWLMKKITKAFGRNADALFYSLLYREILKEINEITENEEESLVIMREIGKQAAYESCERHSSIFKFMPNKPDRVLRYFEILWTVVFGMDLTDYSYEEIPKEGSRFNDYILKISKCPLCSGYGTDNEDTFDFTKVKDENTEGMACGLCGMLESVANFILKIKRSDYRIGIVEEQCIAKGDGCLQLKCKIYDNIEWKELRTLKIQDRLSKGVVFEESLEEEFVQETKFDFIDKLQDVLSLDKIEEILDEPLESIKERVADLIRDKLNLEPGNFFNYFLNYEDDMMRIIGFLFIHLLNEYGGLVDKFLQNNTFAKIFGYIFNQVKEMVKLFTPLDVINDYHSLLVTFLEGLAPPEMVENVKNFNGKDDITFFFEGAQIALENLGIDFTELKENIWEELKKERENGLIDSDVSMVDKTRDKFPKIINIVQEIILLVSEFLTLPIRVFISESHYGIKTAVNSVVSEEEGLFGSIREKLDNIFDYIQEIRK